MINTFTEKGTKALPMANLTVFDFGDGNGPVPAHRHALGDGWVSDTAWVTGNARVSDTARVSGNAWVTGNARVTGNAWVSDDARVSDTAWVSGDARVTGNVQAVPDPSLAGRVLAQIVEHPETYSQRAWHSECGSQHCAAGWIVTFAGDHGRELEQRMGTAAAAAALIDLPLAACAFGDEDDPVPWLASLGEARQHLSGESTAQRWRSAL